jgi:hypothetical protein
MSYQPKDGSGALFKNDKGDNPARPDYRGDVMVGGVLYELSAWIKPLPSDASKKFMSLSAKPKDQRGQPQAPQRQAPARRFAPSQDEDDSSIPF